MKSTTEIFDYSQLAHEILPEWKDVIRKVDEKNFKLNVCSTILGVFGIKYNSSSLLSFLVSITEGDLESLLDTCIDRMEEYKDLLAYHDSYDLVKVELEYSVPENGVAFPENVDLVAVHHTNGSWIIKE